MSRPPPIKSRREVFVDLALRYAEDDSHGYSQKPPSGRWGPDYDCSSLLYQLAKEAGYLVETGGDKVRFTGTMLKDFEKAGFQILPFANVGVSDLEIGDILLNLALHAEVYVGNGESVGATGSENGGYVGEAGDQTGHEIEKHPVTTFDKEWDYILRPPSDGENEEGDEDVPPMNYGQPQGNMYPQGWNNGYTPSGIPQSTVPMGRNYNTGYPQGNLGQMNGYSQANAGYPQSGMQGGYQQGYSQGGMQGYQQGGSQGYPQGMEYDLCFVMGIEGAKNLHGAPNGRKAVFDEDQSIMYIIGFDQQGNCNDIHVYKFEEISEEMPQHLSPLMKQNMMPVGGGLDQQHGDYITRTELEQMLKEMLSNAQSSALPEPNAPRPSTTNGPNGATQSANAGRSR